VELKQPVRIHVASKTVVSGLKGGNAAAIAHEATIHEVMFVNLEGMLVIL